MNRDPLGERSTELFAAARKESPSEETRRRIASALLAQSEPQDAFSAWISEHRRRISFALLSAAAAALTLVLLQSPETVDISAESVTQKNSRKLAGTEDDTSKPTVSDPTSTEKAATSPKSSRLKEQAQTPADAAPDPPPQAPPTLGQELATMQSARSALNGGDAAAALAELAQFGRNPGWRQLRVEASLLRIEALFELGKADASKATEARTEALRFVEEHPNDPLVDRAAKFTQTASLSDSAPSNDSLPSNRPAAADNTNKSSPSERE